VTFHLGQLSFAQRTAYMSVQWHCAKHAEARFLAVASEIIPQF